MSTRRIALLAWLLVSVALPSFSRAADPDAASGDPSGAAAPAAETTTPSKLAVDLRMSAAVTGVELGLVGLSLVLKDSLVPPTCHWCEPTPFDEWARGKLVWGNPQAANTASDALQVLIPVGAAATLWIQAAPHGRREVAEDLMVLAESMTTSLLVTQGVKYAVARLRQDAWARGTIQSPDDVLSFWSGHTSFAFTTAAAATQIARLRGRAGWKWLAAATFGAAALTGYLRVAADRHWTTDVIAGAVTGTATGLVVPLVVFQPADARRPAVALAPAPGGLALLF